MQLYTKDHPRMKHGQADTGANVALGMFVMLHRVDMFLLASVCFNQIMETFTGMQSENKPCSRLEGRLKYP